jgi:murein DD-endopeptidase MepM/ murein hydrolase activator NlpD
MELEMTRRNDLRRPSTAASTLMFQRLGYCLSSLGVLSTTLAYTQTIASAQTSANPVVSSTDSHTVQAFPVATINVAPPETMTRPEVAPSPGAAEAPLEVPAATLTYGQSETITAPTPESVRAADLLPAPTADDTRPVAVELIETPAPAHPVRPAPTAKPSPAAPVHQNRAKTAAKKTTQQTIGPNQAKPVTANRSQTSVKPATPTATIPVVQAEINPVATAAAPVQMGPVSLSSAGISFNTTAIQPYFNPQLLLPPMPGLDQMRMVFPIAIPAPITSLFGWRIHPLTGTQRLHTGTDIGAPMGAPVMASMGGRIILADNMGGYGLAVAIEHDNGIRQTLYGHMSEIFVRPGDLVQQGTVIGRVGSTGASTGPHLHFELRQMLPDGTWVAQDASQHLERSMAQLVQSLQIAQQPQQTAMKPGPTAR